MPPCVGKDKQVLVCHKSVVTINLEFVGRCVLLSWLLKVFSPNNARWRLTSIHHGL